MKKIVIREHCTSLLCIDNYEEYSLKRMQDLYLQAITNYKIIYKKLLDDGAELQDIILNVNFDSGDNWSSSNSSNWIIIRTETNAEYANRLKQEEFQAEKQLKAKQLKEQKDKLKQDPEYKTFVKLSKKFKDLK